MAIGRVPGETGIQPSIVTAKGDLIVATANGSVTNQAVGTNNQVLMADSAQADGVKWANEATATLTTTGDTLYASAANTPARLGIGTTGQVLTVSGGVPSWATPSSGSQTLISTTTLSSTSVTLSSIPQTYNDLLMIISSATWNTGGASIRVLPNNNTIASYAGNDTANITAGTAARVEMSAGLNVRNTGAENVFMMYISNYTSTTLYKPFYFNSAFADSSNIKRACGAGGGLMTTSAITSIVITNSDSFTFTAGTILLYGVK